MLVQEEIARMAVETDAARLLVYRSAMQKDDGILNNTLETVMAKYYSCDVASRVADSALRIHGAYGYSSEEFLSLSIGEKRDWSRPKIRV